MDTSNMACFAEFNEEGVIMEIKGYKALWRTSFYGCELDPLSGYNTLSLIDLCKGRENGDLIVIESVSEEVINITRFTLREGENQLTLNFEESEGEKE